MGMKPHSVFAGGSSKTTASNWSVGILGSSSESPTETWNDNETWWSNFTIKCNGFDETTYIPLAMKIVFGIFFVVFILLSTLGNSIVCYIVHRKPAMRSAINILLANMALCNISLAIICMPFVLLTVITDKWILGKVMCTFEGFFHSLFIAEAVSMLLIISLDRYLIIVLKRDKLTPKRAKYMVCGTWLFNASLCLPPAVGWSKYTSYPGWAMCVLGEFQTKADKGYIILNNILVFYLPATVLVFSYLSIIRTIHHKRLRIHNHPDELVGPASKLGLSVVIPPRVSVDKSFKMRAFKTIFILFILFVVCWMPYGICLTTWNLKHQMRQRFIGGTVVLWLGYLNTALNPIIYCWRIRKFRDACLDIIPRSWKMLPCPIKLQRRVNPASAYEYRDPHPQQLQVHSYLQANQASTASSTV